MEISLKQFAALGGVARGKKLSKERLKEIAQMGVAAKAAKRAKNKGI